MNTVAPDLAAALRQLRDVHLPTVAHVAANASGDVGYSNPAVLTILGVSLVTLTCLAVYVFRRRHVRRALRILDACRVRYRQDRDGPQALATVSAVLRDHACARLGRPPAAGLAGEPWLTFLDAYGGGGSFAQGPGRALLSGPYMAAESGPQPAEVDAVLQLARAWIRRHP